MAWDSTPWPDAPVVAAVTAMDLADRIDARPGWTGFRLAFNFAKTLDAALALLPATKRVALVSGKDPVLPDVIEGIAAYRDRLEFMPIRDLPLAETRRRLAALPQDAIIYYSGIWVDGAGQPFTPQSALRAFAPAANRPIFSYVETYLGFGVVGGVVTDNQKIGNELAGLAARVLSGEAPDSIPVYVLQPSRPIFDGRQLDRWGLLDSRLPPGSQVLFRKPGLWRQYRGEVIAAIAVVLSEAAFIAALLLEIRRRHLLQGELQETSARLINAQDTERSRIARELHDDVSQRLALLALEGEMLSADDAATQVERRARSGKLIEQTRTLASDLHRISHELHPAILDQIGLLPALRHFSDDLARLHEIRVKVDEANWPSGVPPEIELAFYRVAQEALQNVARHSGAREARVELGATDTELKLCVSDNGRGFDPAAARGTSLGLVGMRERLRQYDGQLTVESAPDKGTRVCATVDLNARRS
jgi:signal transduction histidine kinase